jgi:hypothetical protein
MTQNVYIENGYKKYSTINWVVTIDNEHIIANIEIKDKKIPKINEKFLDDHWHLFMIEYNTMFDVWEAVDSTKDEFEKFNEYNYIAPVSKITRTDIDNLIDEIQEKDKLLVSIKDKIENLGELDLLKFNINELQIKVREASYVLKNTKEQIDKYLEHNKDLKDKL